MAPGHTVVPGAETKEHLKRSVVLLLRIAVLVVVIPVRDEVDELARLEAAAPLAAVDVVRQQRVENLPRLAAGAGEARHLRILHREECDLAHEGRFDEEVELLRPLPEVQVVGEEPSQAHQERGAQLRGTLLVHHAADAPALVDDLEEAPDVGTEAVPPDALTDGVDTARELVVLVPAAGAEMRVQLPDRLQEPQRRDQLITLHALPPAHPPAEHESALTRQIDEVGDCRELVLEIPQQHVGGHLGPARVENAEAVTLPRLGGREVHHRTQVRRVSAVDPEQMQRGRNPLQSVHDEDGILQEDQSVLLRVVLPAHAQLDVRDASAVAERLDDLAETRQRRHLPLVRSDLEVLERPRVEDAPQDDAPVGEFVQGGAPHGDPFPLAHLLSPFCLGFSSLNCDDKPRLYSE